MTTSTYDNANKTLSSTGNINSTNTLTATGTNVAGDDMNNDEDMDKENDGNKENHKETTHSSKQFAAISASKQKKMVREKLKNALEEAQQEKPDENADDPRDIEAINYAKKNIGDYKLKSDANYVVPEDEHVNASQKRKQMILLLESINYIKMGLNERVLALRDLKKRIIENITNDTKRLNEINAQLFKCDVDNNNDGQKYVDIIAPTLNLEKEWPQQRYEYTTADLIEFEKVLQQEMEEKSGNTNAYGGGGGDKQMTSSGSGSLKNENTSSGSSISGGRIGNKSQKTYQERLGQVKLSELEKAHLMVKKRELEYEKKVLMEKINSTIHTFDLAVSELREEKYKLMNDLKLTDLKFLTLLKELAVLSNFEDREIELNGKLLKCRTEKAQVVVDLTECQERLSAKLEEIHLWQEKDKKIMKEFDNIVGERNQFYDELKKIFKRKIKRHKRGNNGDGNGDDESDSESSYDSSSDDDDNDGDSDSDGNSDKNDGDDSCPKDCDNLIYEKVMELREKRLDQEEILIEFEKAVNELKSQNISLINKEKNIDKNLFSTEKEIELFQTEKQQVLNKIVITVPLLLSQIRINLGQNAGNNNDDDDGNNNFKLPSTINDLLIFELKSLDNLQTRILQQKNEKIEIKKDYTELKKLHKSLTKKINSKEANIDIEKRKCEQVQFLKYGRLVSLEVLDLNNSTNQETLQLQEKLNKIKKEYKNKYNAVENKLNLTKKHLQKMIQENTKNISILTSLKSSQNNLIEELDKILDIDTIKDSGPSDQKRNRQLQKLVEIAKTQANEIDVLKAEIHMLQRKGGMLYALPEI